MRKVRSVGEGVQMADDDGNTSGGAVAPVAAKRRVVAGRTAPEAVVGSHSGPSEGADLPKPPVRPDQIGSAGSLLDDEERPDAEAGSDVDQEGEMPEGEEEKTPGIFSAEGFRKISGAVKKLFVTDPSDVHLVKKAKELEREDADLLEGLEFKDTLDLGDPHVEVKVFLNPETSEYIYHPIEPILAPRQKEVYEFLLMTLNKALSYNREAMEDPELKSKFLIEEIENIRSDYVSIIGNLSEEFIDPILYYLKREFISYGKIHCLMLDQGVEDISCDGTDIPVFVYHRDYGSIRTTISYETDEILEGYVVSLAQRAGKSITVADPILDATLPEGHRLNATFGREVTTRGCSYTIRKFKEDPLTITDLVGYGTLSTQMAAHFWLAVQYGESMIFSGGTASGKTATMNAISIFIPTSAKIVSIEDTREVNLPHQNWIAGITRGGAEGDKAGDINMYHLLRAALRQRPEYVIVGEVRGKETMTMFQAMATGHTTYSTMHADSVKSIVYRLENPPISIPRVLIQALNLVAIHNQLRVEGKRVRRVTELVEIVGIEPTSLEVITNRVYGWEAAGDHFDFGGHSNLYEKIMDMEDMTRDEVVFELNRRAEVIEWLERNDVRQYRDVSKIVVEYYESPEKVMTLLREYSTIDITEGLRIFDEEVKERLPPSNQDLLPAASVDSVKAAEAQGGA